MTTKNINISRIEELKSILNSLYTENSQLHNKYNKEVAGKLTQILNPKHPIGVRVGTESIEFFTAVKSTENNSEVLYADFGSNFNLYNHYNHFTAEALEGMITQFNPELNSSSISMNFDNGSPYELTKVQMLYFIGNEIQSQGEFNNYIKEVFIELRKFQKNIRVYETQLRDIQNEIEKEKETEFFNNLKVGNWYKISEYYFYKVEKITDKYITFEVMKSIKSETLKIAKNQAFNSLKNAELLEENPYDKIIKNILN